VFFDSCDGLFCGIDTMAVRGDELDGNLLGPDMFFDCGGTFVVYYVQCQLLTSLFHYGERFGEYLYHGNVCARGHGKNNDCIEDINKCNKYYKILVNTVE
jgi:hypothetical protein